MRRSPDRKRAYFEDYSIILDILGSRLRRRAQAIGEKYFTLLELALVPGIKVEVGRRVYIGINKDMRLEVERVIRTIRYEDLTFSAKSELPSVVRRIVESNERRFVEFFNGSGPITIKLHQLELLPNIGKKTMWKILEERRVKPFTSFKDIEERVGIRDPCGKVVERILEELRGGSDPYKLFVSSRAIILRITQEGT
ncbi:MAG: DUF655 domain-containing protein [Thermoproteota archaeon]|nr:MAG: DUF655 domain-containing protein [Candidatus Korarchaeota archaeon]RLG54967.1 MAG: DUF655 domain-containing protein [Candidatus Korarchaeota archaeon]